MKKPNGATKPLRLDTRAIRRLAPAALPAVAGASTGAYIVEPIRPPRI
jgi:hypothetical protein